MPNPRGKHYLAAVILPVYGALWLTGAGCFSRETSALLEGLMLCYDLGGGRVEHAADPARGFEIPGFEGAILFGEAPGQVLPNKKRSEILSLSFGMPVTIPAASTTLYGFINPFPPNPAPPIGRTGVPRPRKLLVELVEVDTDGKAGKKVTYALKVQGDVIKQVTKKTPELQLSEGESLALYVKPKGNDLSLAEIYQMFFELPIDARLVASVQNLRATGTPLPGMLRPSFELRAGASQEIFSARVGVDMNMPQRDITVSGTYSPAAGIGVTPASGATPRGAPSKIVLTVQHLDADGDQQARFTLKAKINGTNIAETTKRFRGFALAAGESIRFTMRPKGGGFAAGDQVSLLLGWVEP